MKRSAGVLMNISSLPSPYGIGTFGKSARLFCDFLAAGGFSVWQVLPLGTLDQGFSPYASDGAFAGNPLYIDPELLYQEGLITRKELDSALYTGSPYTVDYVWLTENRNALLKNAYHHASPALKEAAQEYAKKSG